jgi:hypothetical protein
MAEKWKYLPILKWKLGERMALKHLTPAQWDSVVPLVELHAIDASPSADSLRAELPAYLAKISKEMAQAFPEDVPLLIDVRHVSTGYPRQLALLRVICNGLAKQTKRRVFPVLSETMVARYAGNLGDVVGFEEYVLRIQTPLTDESQVQPMVKQVTGSGIVPKGRLHLVIDQYSIVNEDARVRFTMVKPYLDEALAAGCASTTVAGGSFPVNLVGFKQGVHDITRVEWAVWAAVRRVGAYAPVRYGDYTVSNPAPAPDLDPQMMNPSVAIRYATNDHWRLYKAGGFKKGKPNQYQNLCTLLTGDAVYSGPAFSDGDDRYDRAANAKLGNGNPSSWRRDATSHHVVFVSSLL